MKEYVGQIIRADRGNVGGAIYFYPDHLKFTPRHYRYGSLGFEIPYASIVSYDVVPTHKKRVNIHTANETVFFELYHIDLCLMLLDQAIKEAQGADAPALAKPKAAPAAPAASPAAPAAAKPAEKEDDLDALARLAALYSAGALTEEEFAAMKAKIINGK